VPGETELLATMYAFGAMLSFTVAHVAVIKLRQVYPDRERGWKPPLGLRVGGLELPLTGLLGGMGTFAAWIVVMALNTRTLLIGGAWMLVGMTVYLLYRRSQDLPLKQTVKVLMPEPLGVEEVEYQSVLVAFEEDPFSEEMTATAARLAARRRRGIHVLSLIDVPTHLPLDAPLEAEEAEAQSKIERAKLICGQRATGHVERVRPGQAGHAIAQEARDIKAAVIVVQLTYRNGTPLYGKTLEAVLSERPCRVIVVAEPESARDGGGTVPVGV
jgi:APA family basic amino acid/polyamine antiporter